MPRTVKLAEYLFTRLRQLGVQSIHGVPGDYNLALLDYVEPELHWVGNCNELNAGYAADAYSRIKGLGALITTFGVGELSAANAIAGAYAELAPVVHIVGTPARHVQDSRARIHHTFNDGDFRRFAQMAQHITVAQASLWDPRTCPHLIDSTIQQCLIHSRPVYIQVPADMVAIEVAAENLDSKIEIPEPIPAKDESAALKLVLDRIYASQRPMILVDGESKAYDILDEVSQLIKLTQWPTWTTIFGKSLVDETLPNFNGIWKGNSANQSDKDYVESSDLILCFGPHFSTTNSYGGSSVPDAAKSILFTATGLTAQDQSFGDLPAKPFLSKLLSQLNPSKLHTPAKNPALPTLTPQPSDGLLTQDQFYHHLSPFFRPGDIILAETGTAGHGSRDFALPPHTHLFKPVTWLSIGYMLPAAQGAALAQRELHAAGAWPHSPPRTVLLIGDGSFQMTAQELSTIVREQLHVVVFLLNNDGYTIERCLHGWDRRYNDVAPWRYLAAPALFGAGEEGVASYPASTCRVATWGELKEVVEDRKMREGPALRMVEVVMGREDAPIGLLTLLNQQKDSAGKKG